MPNWTPLEAEAGLVATPAPSAKSRRNSVIRPVVVLIGGSNLPCLRCPGPCLRRGLGRRRGRCRRLRLTQPKVQQCPDQGDERRSEAAADDARDEAPEPVV